MSYRPFIFLIGALLAAPFGFTDISLVTAAVAKLVFILFMILFMLTFVSGLMSLRGRQGSSLSQRDNTSTP